VASPLLVTAVYVVRPNLLTSLSPFADLPIRKVLAHPRRGHSLEPPEAPGASFLVTHPEWDHVHVARTLSSSNDGKLLFGLKRVGKIGRGVV
jgi:hypothetical protein